uniref:hypothetical protein n=1 Tax=Roseivirga sp. TaxID=1964215 RepID=UPI004047C5AA
MIYTKSNEILVSDYNNAWKFGVLNFDTKKIVWETTVVWLWKILRGKKRQFVQSRGLSQKIGKSRLTFFRYKSQLYFLSKDQLFLIDKATESNLIKERNELVFNLTKNGERVFENKHRQIKSIIPIENDPTPMVEQEDFDIRMLIYNVLLEHDRRDRIFPEN